MGELDQPEAAQLTVQVEPDGNGGPVLHLHGELDLSTVTSLDAVLDPLLESAPERLAFDVSGLQFMDSSGLAVLVRCSARVPTVTLRHATPIVRRVIEASGLADVLPLEP